MRYVFVVDSVPKEEAIVLSEGVGFAWFTLDEAMQLDLTPGTRHDLEYFRAEAG
jgi:hypothetical protein